MNFLELNLTLLYQLAFYASSYQQFIHSVSIVIARHEAISLRSLTKNTKRLPEQTMDCFALFHFDRNDRVR